MVRPGCDFSGDEQLHNKHDGAHCQQARALSANQRGRIHSGRRHNQSHLPLHGQAMKRALLVFALSVAAHGQTTVISPSATAGTTVISAPCGSGIIGENCGSSFQTSSDNFNRANGALGANWTKPPLATSALTIVSNAVMAPSVPQLH